MWFFDNAVAHGLTLCEGIYKEINGVAVFDDEKKHRYFLEKRWASDGDVLTAYMMNPSNATHNAPDDTVDQLMDVAKRKGCNALHVVNISSVICGSSSKMKNLDFRFNTINMDFCENAMKHGKYVFLGWGVKGQDAMAKHLKTNRQLIPSFEAVNHKLYTYEVPLSKDKKLKNLYYPAHPRPREALNRYVNVPIRLVDSFDFSMLFK